MADHLSAIVENKVTSAAGYIFDPLSLGWKISRDNHIYLSWTNDFLSQDLKHSFLKVLTHYAQTTSAGHTNSLSDRFRELARFTHTNHGVINRITSSDLISYRATLDREHEWYLGTLRGFLKTWVALGYSGVDENVPNLLDNWRLKGNVRGAAPHDC